MQNLLQPINDLVTEGVGENDERPRDFRSAEESHIRSPLPSLMKIILPLFASLLVIAGVHSQKPPGPPTDAAEKLAEVIHLRAQLGGGFEAMMPMVKGMSESMKLSAEESRALEVTFRSWYLEDFDHNKIYAETIRLYATTFSEEELVIMTQFYGSPVGQKALTMMPDLLKQSVVMAMVEGKAKQEQLKARIERLFSERVSVVPGVAK